MITYIDASALVKRYVAEAGSADVARLIREADVLGTGVVSRAEVDGVVLAGGVGRARNRGHV